MKLCLIFFGIIFLIVKNKKFEQKTFDEIFGEKWEEKEEEKRNDQNENDQKKREIVAKFNKIKEKIKEKGRKYLKKEWNKIEEKIGKKFGTNRKYIYQWIKELGLNKCHNKTKTDEQKIEIVQKFIAMKNEYKQKGIKYSRKEWNENYAEIGKKIGVSRDIIIRWKKQFGMSERITKKEKMEKMKIYWQKKEENPKMSDEKIAKILKINRQNICKWKKQLGEELNEN